MFELCSMFEVATLFGGLSNEGFVQLPQSRLQLQQNSVATSCISAPPLPQQLQQQTIGGWQKWCGGNRQACCCCCCCFLLSLLTFIVMSWLFARGFECLGPWGQFRCVTTGTNNKSVPWSSPGSVCFWDGGSRSTDFRISDSSESTVAGHMSTTAPPPRYQIIGSSSVNAAAGCCSCLFRQCCGCCFLLAPHGHLTDNG